ncbi:hypothetical protein I553_2999 [Mycobacterium xenopi 4042]|uniref:Uncharacterized protein n=1 Tax=Mycobacterium xenopi 4042 TaxID=1299334 RepID=X8EFE4_MYCXE|nr:hypothetical protein I553_2999 [Mycobacterium xenopi 4042]
MPSRFEPGRARIQIEDKTFAGLISLRLPTDRELAEAGYRAP